MNKAANHNFRPVSAKQVSAPRHNIHVLERFRKTGSSALSDCEVLELILHRAIRKPDLKTLASNLLEEFGDFNHVISANPNRLATISGIGPAAIRELKIVEASAHRLAKAKIIGRNVLDSWDTLMEYCKISMAHLETEQFRVLFLDRKNKLIADEEQSRGTVDHVPVYPREVLKRALELNASAIILVHNHPTGDPTPSQADKLMTARIEAASQALSITLHDHIIIGKETDASFRGLGLL